MPIYNPLKPQPDDQLDVSQSDLQGNFQQANIVMDIDHIPFDNVTSSQGYHKVIHQTAFSTVTTDPPNNYPASPPPTIGLIGQLYTAQTNDGVNVDETLYYLTGAGRNLQLTMNFSPNGSYQGYTFLPGGLIFQWGFINRTSTGSDVNIPFNIPFPSAVIAMWGSGYFYNAVPNDGATVQFKTNHVSPPSAPPNTSKTTFNYYFNTNSGSYTGFQWFAIGN